MNRDSGTSHNLDSDSTPSSTASPLIVNQHDSSSIQQVNLDSRYDHDLGLRPTQSSIDSSLMPRQNDSSNVQQCYPYSSYSSASYQDQHFHCKYQETYPASTLYKIYLTIITHLFRVKVNFIGHTWIQVFLMREITYSCTPLMKILTNNKTILILYQLMIKKITLIYDLIKKMFEI